MTRPMTNSQHSRRCSDSAGQCHSERMELSCRKHKADQNKRWLICVVSLWSGGCGKAAENQTESHWFSHGKPSLPPPPSKHTPSESDGWRGEHAHHLTYKHAPQTRCPTPHLGLATTPSSPISPWLSHSLSPCLIYAFAEQLLPRELREQHSHLSTLVTRCHLLLPAHRTSRQTMPHAFWTSDLRRLSQRGLGGALDLSSHGWWSSKPHRQWHLQLVHTHLNWKATLEALIPKTALRYLSFKGMRALCRLDKNI